MIEDDDVACNHCGARVPPFTIEAHERHCSGKVKLTTGAPNYGKFFPRQRLEWIADMMKVYGFINTSHISRKFDVSHQTATWDMQEYIRRNPSVRYDKRAKVYLDSNEGPRPLVDGDL